MKTEAKRSSETSVEFYSTTMLNTPVGALTRKIIGDLYDARGHGASCAGTVWVL
jgi:hypothetical protein